ncbi:MAG: hypothetical protein U0X20_09705 [Caldilineaceae bacterium]
MKVIVRTLIILAAALIVVAAAVGFAQSSFAVALAPNLPAEERGEAPVFVTDAETAGADATGSSVTFSAAGTTASDATQAGTTTADTGAADTGEAPVLAGEGSRPGHGEAGGIQGVLPLAKNFAIMALIVGVVALGSQGLARLRQGRMRLQAR